MKKKLAIFTLAVGFFTLCNIVLYTRKLRADEMTTFWHWSAQRAGGGPNCSLAQLGDQPSCGGGANASGPIPSSVDGGSSSRMANLSRPTLSTASVAPPTTLRSFQDGRQSSISSQAYFVFENQTHYLTADSIVGSAVSTQVSLPALNRTIRVTFNISLFIDHGITLRGGNGAAAASTPKNAVTVTGLSTTATTPSVTKNAVTALSLAATAPSVAKNSTGLADPVASNNGLTVLNRHPFGYLINVKDLCGGGRSPLTLVILVTTAVNHFAHRKAIRDTWGGLAKRLSNVRLAFVMGRPTDPAVQPIVMQESLLFADIVQEDFADTYKNLTLKTVMLMRWVRDYCPKARFIMKSDDDVFINLSNLLKYIQSLRLDRKLLFGRLVKGARPLRSRSSKYFVPMTEYKDNVYPDYLSGTAYVMSADVAPRLIQVSEATPIFFFEDVFITGICAKKAGIARRNHAGFVYYKRQVKGCAYYRVISGHNNTPNDMRKIWKELQRKDFRC